jgi:hypothetical protein
MHLPATYPRPGSKGYSIGLIEALDALKIHAYLPHMGTSSKLTKPYEAVPELDTPRYLLGDAAAGANISASLLKMWVSRDPKVISFGFYDQEGRGKGTPRLFTLRRVTSIAVAAELVALGIKPSRAGDLARAYTDYKHKEGRYIELAEPTFLIVEPRSTALILETSASRTFGQVLNRTVPSTGEKPASFAVISASAVKQRVIARLKRRGV